MGEQHKDRNNRIVKAAGDSSIAQIFNALIKYGVEASASDIHIEPREDVVVVRYRIDGLLSEANKLPHKSLSALVGHIKTLSNMKVEEHRKPQDGLFKVNINGTVHALRVSILPIMDGEKVVIRILNESSQPASLTELGLWGNALSGLQHAIVEPHGMVLITGPTGAGKSTTLFSILSSLNSATVNMSTVEDPIEYHVVGVNQTQVNPVAGITFTSGLRALLRQDPNIIMISEIHDGEIADAAVQAALSGHLVFSTLPTNNAASGLLHLLDIGVEPFLIASTVRVVVAQQLVRRLCTDCREAFAPDATTLKRIEKSFDCAGNGGIKKIHELENIALQDGIGKAVGVSSEASNSLSSSKTAIRRLWRPRHGGCKSCNQTGYKGRIGIYEVLNNSETIKKLIVSNATSKTIEQTAIDDGMLTMQLDGLIKALRGQTSIEEVLRVTSHHEELKSSIA